MEHKRIIIVGAGFGGVSAAQELSKNPNHLITLIDRRNFHLFQPLLYQVAMSGLSPADISVPLRTLFRDRGNVDVILAEVDQIDCENRRVHFDDKWLEADELIFACGSKHAYFGNDQWEEFAPGLKNIEQAVEIRRRVLMAFELAEKETNPEIQQKDLTFVVVGGGPTGVELAGAIAEMASRTLVRDFHRVDLKKTRVILVEAGSRVLAAFPEKLSEQAKRDLEHLGVEVQLNTRASDLSKDGLKIRDQFVPCRTIIWAAGVRPSSLTAKLPTPKDSIGRAVVNRDLSVPGFPHVFVIGDQAGFIDPQGKPLPGLAPVAIQQGQFLAKVLQADSEKKARPQFQYFDKGIMATIGRSKAVFSSGKIQFSGLLAWLAWVFVHILTLIQFRNRVFVLLQWAWSYFTFGNGARLITYKTWRFYSGEKVKLD